MTSSYDATVQPAAILATVTNEPVPIDEARTICSEEQEIWVGEKMVIAEGIPYWEAFSLYRG